MNYGFIATVSLTIAAAAASAGPWEGQSRISPDITFFPRDVAPFDGVPDDLLDHCVRWSAGENTVACYEFDLEPLIAAADLLVDMEAIGWSAPMQGAYLLVRVEVYPADGIASLDDASVPGAEIGLLATTGRLDNARILSDINPLVRAYRDAGYTHLGIRMTNVVQDARCWTTEAAVVITFACPWCIYDYNRDGSWETLEDIVAFVADWSRGHPCTDVDGSGNVDFDYYNEWIDRLGGQDCYP